MITILASVDLDALRQFLYEGDFLGFLQAVYANAFGSPDLFYGIVCLGIIIPIYIRTKSLMFLAVVWILLGSLFLAAMPLVSNLAVLLMAMGIAGLLWTVFMRVRR